MSGDNPITLEMLDLSAAGEAAIGPETDTTTPGAGGGLLSWLGLRQVPATIWLAGLLTGFALIGHFLQMDVSQLTGAAVWSRWGRHARVSPRRCVFGMDTAIPITPLQSHSTRKTNCPRGLRSCC
ncbi:DUF1449 family protein [Actibacterium sp. 188UL27-1]|nr:DUF1449 family protein [Actibacterium sp. 188UL27-1]